MVILQAIDLAVPPARPGAEALLPGQVSLSLEEDEVLAVGGASGSGKTTLLRCMALLEPRARGRILFRGEEIAPADTPSYRRQVAYLPQQPPRFPMEVEESLARPFEFRCGGRGQFPADRAESLCRRLALPADVMTRWVPDLSVGEAQRVALVRTLIAGPSVLLLDEFTAALDPRGQAAAEALVTEWLSEGRRSAVLVSHDAAQASKMATRAITLNRPEE